MKTTQGPPESKSGPKTADLDGACRVCRGLTTLLWKYPKILFSLVQFMVNRCVWHSRTEPFLEGFGRAALEMLCKVLKLLLWVYRYFWNS